MPLFQSLPGFREFYPDALARRNHIFRIWRQTALAFGFAEYDAPVLEPLELYKAKSGEEIEQQLFNFVDKGGREIALRPEMTPTVCRMVGARAGSLKRPIKWFSVAEFYRYERAQKGRERAFFQFNADVFGEAGVEAEIELIALLIQCLAAFGLTEQDFKIRLSDRDLWFFYLGALGLDDARIRAMLTAIDKYDKIGEGALQVYSDQFGPLAPETKGKVLSFLGTKSYPEIKRQVDEVAEAALAKQALDPQKVEALMAYGFRLREWEKLLDGLAAMGLASYVEPDLGVVRGLAYYTGFVFEAFDRKGDLRALAGGGRYNNLVAKLGGPDLPAVGFAIGDVTTALLLEARGLLPAYVQAADIYAVLGGEDERRIAFRDIHALRAAGYRVEYPLKPLAFGKQFKAALESGAKLALIYGGDELARGMVKIRDLAARTERDVPRADVLTAVRDFFAGA